MFTRNKDPAAMFRKSSSLRGNWSWGLRPGKAFPPNSIWRLNVTCCDAPFTGRGNITYNTELTWNKRWWIDNEQYMLPLFVFKLVCHLRPENTAPWLLEHDSCSQPFDHIKRRRTILAAPAPTTNHKFISFKNPVADSVHPDSMINDGTRMVSGRPKKSGSFLEPAYGV